MEERKPTALAELTFYPKRAAEPVETPKIKFKVNDMSKPKPSNENTNIFSFTFNRHKYSTPSPGG